MGNLANTNAFKQFSLFLSKFSFPRVPSVFLVLSSCFVKNAQRCLCFSAFNITCTSLTLLGVTQVRMISSPTGILLKSVTGVAEAASGVAGGAGSVKEVTGDASSVKGVADGAGSVKGVTGGAGSVKGVTGGAASKAVSSSVSFVKACTSMVTRSSGKSFGN